MMMADAQHDHHDYLHYTLPQHRPDTMLLPFNHWQVWFLSIYSLNELT